MKRFGNSSLWEVKYKPTCIDDYICSADVKALLNNIVESKEVPTLLLSGVHGSGKTSLANVISNELGMDMLYINGSCENGIDVIREKVIQFATTHSLMDGKKLIVIDEADRLGGGIGASKGSNPAQDALKVIVEETESNARFIFCTNNPQNIIPPLKSRCRIIEFTNTKSPEIALQYFKRICWILTNEGVSFDKKVVAEITNQVYPDMRKLINAMQLYYQQHGKIDEMILVASDSSVLEELIQAMKIKRFESIVKTCQSLEPSMIFSDMFYETLKQHVSPECLPDIIGELNEHDYKMAFCSNKLLCAVDCILKLVSTIKWI